MDEPKGFRSYAFQFLNCGFAVALLIQTILPGVWSPVTAPSRDYEAWNKEMTSSNQPPL